MNRRSLYVAGGVGLLAVVGIALAAGAAAADDDDDLPDLDVKKPVKPGGGDFPRPKRPIPPGGIKKPTKPGEKPEGPKRQPTGPAPVDVTKIENDYPTPWTFYQVKKRDTFYGTSASRSIAYRYLMSAAFLAAKANGASDEQARAFAKDIAKTGDGAGQRRAQAADVILCHAGNDMRYGTYRVPANQNPSPSGRTILLLPRYKNNRVAMSKGGPLERTIGLEGGNFHVTDSQHRAYPYLMMPGLDLNALWLQRVVRPADKNWPDGNRSMHDPAAVAELELDVFPGDDLAGVTFGCMGGEYKPF